MAADEEDNEPRKTAGFEPRVLERMSIDELRDYIAALKAEIARAEADIKAKESVRAGAEAFFRK